MEIEGKGNEGKWNMRMGRKYEEGKMEENGNGNRKTIEGREE